MALVNFTDEDVRILRQVINREQTRKSAASNPPVARYPSDFVRLMKAPQDGIPAATYDEQTEVYTAGTAEASPQRIELDDQAEENEIKPCDDPEEQSSFDIPVFNFLLQEIKADAIFAVGRDAFGQYIVLHEQPKLALCKVEKTGGDQGDASTQCGWEYTIKDLETDEDLATSVDVNDSAHPYERPDAGQLTEATYGLIYLGSMDPPEEPAVVWLNEALITCPQETP